MTSRAKWESNRMGRMGDIIRERASFHVRCLALSKQGWLTPEEERELTELSAHIDECDRDLTAIEAETYEQVMADAASHEADERQKEDKL